MTHVYKVELAIIDHDEIGGDEIKEVLENTRYPNRCISPEVLTVEEKDIGEWYDEHPLNYRDTAKQELARLFGWQPIKTAPRDGTHILFFYGSCRGVFTAWYSKEIEWQTDSQTGYSTWHLREPDSVISAILSMIVLLG